MSDRLFDPGQRHGPDPIPGSMDPRPRMLPSTAARHLQGQLFYSAKEYRDMVTDSVDLRPGQTMDQVWDRKLIEAKQSKYMSNGEPRGGHGAGVYDSVKKHGVRHQPVITMRESRNADGDPQFRGFSQGQGHHRAVSAMDLGHWMYPKIAYPEDHRGSWTYMDTGVDGFDGEWED